jgi:hypothetical protein
MQHELAHAWVADTGGRSEETVPGTDVGRREVDATIIEDEYREAVGLDLRTRYDGAAVPTPTPIPETGSSILMLLIGIGALWCFARHAAAMHHS